MYDPRFADKQPSIERNIRRSTEALARIKNIKYNEFGEVNRYNRRNQRLSVEGRVIRAPVVKDAAYERRRAELLRKRALGRTGRATVRYVFAQFCCLLTLDLGVRFWLLRPAEKSHKINLFSFLK